MTQLIPSLDLTEPSPRDSTVVRKDEDDWTHRISSVMPLRAAERIVVASDDPTCLLAPCGALERDGYELSFARLDALPEIADALEMDLVLIDMTTAPSAAVALCRRLRTEPSTCHVPVVLMTSDAADEELVASALMAGADDCIVTNRSTSELLARVRVQLRNKSYRDALSRVRGERDSFRREASLDPLTHLPNRNALFAVLRRSIERREPFAVLFLDLDHFKRVNDELGHAMGDEVLRAASACLKQHARSNDCCGRFGGEEFLVLLDCAGGAEALHAADRHRRAIEKLCFEHPRGTVRITASVGIAVYDPESPVSMEELLDTADAALYEAKRSGRNRTFLARRPVAANVAQGA